MSRYELYRRHAHGPRNQGQSARPAQRSAGASDHPTRPHNPQRYRDLIAATTQEDDDDDILFAGSEFKGFSFAVERARDDMLWHQSAHGDWYRSQGQLSGQEQALVQQAFESLDLDHNASLSLRELLAAGCQLPEELMEAYSRIPADGMSFADLRAFCVDFKKEQGPEALGSLLKRCASAAAAHAVCLMPEKELPAVQEAKQVVLEEPVDSVEEASHPTQQQVAVAQQAMSVKRRKEQDARRRRLHKKRSKPLAELQSEIQTLDQNLASALAASRQTYA
eukprot:TRINITY_DN19888_c0_g1_i4.p1 TRINITY_DN19888_c0_g1~~TRINITY_DN19888_c0_g1_i4.p1  ORF type:complete len:279 (+),score=65.09 TRINITY_DN19888_c0_g1_i4:303-1139(+)